MRDAVVDEIDRARTGHVVVVGHSLAGIFVPAAVAQRPDRVAHLVLVAAVIPPEGTTQRRNMPWAARIGMPLLTRDGVLAPMPSWLARVMFCNDMDSATADWLVGGLVPETVGLFDEPVVRAGLPRVPATYVRLRRDGAVGRRLARRQIANYGSGLEVLEIDSGHAAMVSRPEQLARVLNSCAGRSC